MIDHGANVNAKAKNGLTPMHLCAQEDKVAVAGILAKSKADIDPQTKVSRLSAKSHRVLRCTQMFILPEEVGLEWGLGK